MIAAFWQRHRRLRHLAISALVAAIFSTILSFVPRDNILQGVLTDLNVAARVMVFGVKPLSDAKVLVVGIDERSLSSPELLKHPRVLFSPIYAELAKKTFAHKGRGLILDIILAYDASSLEIGGERPLRKYDTDFLKLLNKYGRTSRLIIGRSAQTLPARRFAQVAKNTGMGHVQLKVGSGNVIRIVDTDSELASGELVRTLSGRGLDMFGTTVNRSLDLLPPAPLDTLPSASLVDILRCEDAGALDALFADRVVLIGGMLPDEDRLKTADRFIPREVQAEPPGEGADPCDFVQPYTRGEGPVALPGVYTHAGGIDGVVSGWLPSPVPAAVVPVLAGVFCLIACLAALVLRPVVGAALLIVLLSVCFLCGAAALELGFFLPVAAPMVAIPLGFGATFGIRLGLLDRRANTIRREFGRYLSPILVQRMIETGHAPELGGEERDVTVLFADLSGFTATSEMLESAELTKVLNRYLDRIAGVIRDQGGYVDKFIGDAVMAFWNAPAPVENHELAATEAGYLIHTAIESMASQDRAKGLPAFSIKIGISSGLATVGNVGAQDRLNYTVIGETVNLAARFESLPGLFKTPVVIGPRTAEMVIDHYVLLPIVAIQVKGKTNGVRVYAPILRRADMNAVVNECLEDYAIALSAFEEGAFETAAELWISLAERAWPGAGPAGAMAEEARFMQKQILLTPWTGVLEARSK